MNTDFTNDTVPIYEKNHDEFKAGIKKPICTEEKDSTIKRRFTVVDLWNITRNRKVFDIRKHLTG